MSEEGATVVVGAGVAGLTLAERLLANGAAGPGGLVVLEREQAPGGLARTFERDGFHFDIGPHRFHTSDPTVERYLLHVLGDDYVSIPRSSSVYMAGKYRDWPLNLSSVMGLPVGLLLRSVPDLFRSGRRSGETPESFADHIVARYGRNLYDYFFSGYTRKFTGMEAELLHVDWAAAGVNRAVIDRKVRADSLASLLRGLLLPSPVRTTFYYPSSGGIQTFCDRQAAMIESRGGEVRLGEPATGVETAAGRVEAVLTGSGRIPAARVYWSAPISLILPSAGFRFMSTVLCNIALARPQGNEYQWCYFGQEDILFSRLTVPPNFRRDTAPEGADSLVAEITVRADSPAWREPESMRERLLDDLERVGAVSREDVLFVDWRRVPETYPLYDLGYRERLAAVETPRGLHLLGRCGSFWYNNMDHSIGQGIAMASGERFQRDFWKG